MKNVNFAGLEARRPDLMPLAREASKLLEDELGQSAPLVRAAWDAGEDERGRSIVSLGLSDFTGSVEYRFAPDELANADHMRVKLHRLWGDLLMVQSHVQLDRLRWQVNHAGVD